MESETQAACQKGRSGWFFLLLALALTNYATAAGTVSYTAVFIGVAGLILLLKYKISIFKVILISAGLGLLLIR